MAERLKIASSNLEAAPRDLWRWKPADWQKFSGSAGLLWSDIRGTRTTAIRLARAGAICAWHQSWRQLPCLRHPRNFGNDAKFSVVMPSVRGSLNTLGDLQSKASAWLKLPIVVHPNRQDLNHRPSKRAINYERLAASGIFSALRYQLTAEVAARWQLPLDQPGELAERLQAGISFSRAQLALEDPTTPGWRQTIADGKHWFSERAGHQFKDPLAVARELGQRGLIEEVHFGVQPDFDGSFAELKAVIDGNIAKTRQGRLVQTVLQAVPSYQAPPTVVTEVPAYAFERLGIPYLEGHALLREQIQTLAA